MLKNIRNRVRSALLISAVIIKNPLYLKYLPRALQSPLQSRMPWLNFATKEWLDRNLNKELVVFEYGCGGSTLYLAPLVKQMISVEHDRAWHDIVKNKLSEYQIDNCELYCCPPEEALPGGNPLYLSSDENFPNKSFQKYIEKINDYPDDYFNLIVVDGRARNGCIANLLPKIKDGGYVLLDNSERKEYLPSLELLANFKVETFFAPGFQSPRPSEAKIWQIKK